MIAEVIVDILNSEVDKVFDYGILSNQDIKVGERVLVPFGNRNIEGYVINIKKSTDIPLDRLKNIIKPLDKFVAIKPEFIQLMHFMTHNYNTRKADCLRLFIPPVVRNKSVKEKIIELVSYNSECNFTPKSNATSQINAIEYVKNNPQTNRTQLNNMFSSACVNSLINKQIFIIQKTQQDRNPYKQLQTQFKAVELTPQQQTAKNVILNNTNKTILLHGVTGSGKTEVYLKCIKSVLEKGQTAIMLVPEIALTPQMLKIFRSHFGNDVALLHSGLNNGERLDEWQKLHAGKAKVAIGARSCIFAPLENVGLIIIDEEHDSSYVSQTNPRYNTHEVAKFRAEYNNCNLVLGSATPSIDTYNQAINNQIMLVEMPQRIMKKQMPQIQIVNMAEEMLSGNASMFSKKMIYELSQCITEKNQAMIFLNRRGYSSFVMCKECGYVAKCTDCDATLVYHKEENMLKCHFCSKRYHMLSQCQDCKSKFIKQGYYGTEQVVSELQKIFKNVKILRMDNDTTANKDGHLKILEEFAKTKPAILVGTQMIAKGHDFGNVTFVGILDADIGLHTADYRATERTFQLITQVAGRAGRAEKEGKVVLQTYVPKHYVYRLASNYNYKDFFYRELNARQTTAFPPYSVIVRILSSSENENLTREQIRLINQDIQVLKEKYKRDIIFCEAMKSPVKRVQKKFRYQILMRIIQRNSKEIIQKVYNIVNIHSMAHCTCFTEINPQNLS